MSVMPAGDAAGVVSIEAVPRRADVVAVSDFEFSVSMSGEAVREYQIVADWTGHWVSEAILHMGLEVLSFDGYSTAEIREYIEPVGSGRWERLAGPYGAYGVRVREVQEVHTAVTINSKAGCWKACARAVLHQSREVPLGVALPTTGSGMYSIVII